MIDIQSRISPINGYKSIYTITDETHYFHFQEFLKMHRGSLKKQSQQGRELFLKFLKTSVTKLTNHHNDPADMCRLSRRLRVWNCGTYNKVIDSDPSLLKDCAFNKEKHAAKWIVGNYDELYVIRHRL